MQAVAEIEAKQETENRVMGDRERMEQLRQKELYHQTWEADYRDDFEAGWDAGKAYAESEAARV